jgi:DNA-binding NarL/FixJ family response regulator
MAEVAGFSAPAELVVEPYEERPDAVLFSFPLEQGEPLGELTPAERGVLDGVRHGLSNAQIARLRGVSVRTVANQIATLFKKVGAQSRLDLALLAARTERGCPEGRTHHRRSRRGLVR